MVNKAVILDRDGTLIDFVRERGPYATAVLPCDIRVLPGVIGALWILQAAGFRLAIATNQGVVAKGQATAENVARTNAALLGLLASEGIHIQAVKVCMHHPSVSACTCRKPAAGMLAELVSELELDPTRSWMVGDMETDVEAGLAAGLRTMRVKECGFGPEVALRILVADRGEVTPRA